MRYGTPSFIESKPEENFIILLDSLKIVKYIAAKEFSAQFSLGNCINALFESPAAAARRRKRKKFSDRIVIKTSELDRDQVMNELMM